MEDLFDMMPHSRKESKLEKKTFKDDIDDLCFSHTCTNSVFLEARRRKDIYMWLNQYQDGPSAKFHITNVSATGELKMTGNSLKGSRPMLSFDNAFSPKPGDKNRHLMLIKEMLIHSFGTP